MSPEVVSQLVQRMHSDPRAMKAGIEAMGLWHQALWHCADYRTGHVMREVAARLAGSPRTADRLAAALVNARLWRRTSDDGWTFTSPSLDVDAEGSPNEAAMPSPAPPIGAPKSNRTRQAEFRERQREKRRLAALNEAPPSSGNAPASRRVTEDVTAAVTSSAWIGGERGALCAVLLPSRKKRHRPISPPFPPTAGVTAMNRRW